MHAVAVAFPHAARAFGGGPKGPPSAPPAIPPIIINPFNRQQPNPSIDPRRTPVGPPVMPPGRPGFYVASV